ncbi:MAG: DUF420 domain-containing protein [Pirellulaceae bacterium]
MHGQIMDAVALIGQNYGFLPTRGSIMIDFVFAAMFGIILVLGMSIYLVRYQRKYQLHKWIQIVVGLVLLVAVVAFEVDMRLFTNWRELAEPSPYYQGGLVDISLGIHLCFAIPTPVLWIVVIWRALKRFPNPPIPGDHSASHVFWGWLAAIGMLMTAVTGWVFYFLAFVA